MVSSTSADEVREALGLVPMPVEGGWWVQTQLDEVSSAIYYLLEAGEHSRLHRLASREIYHYYAGAPLDLLVVDPDGEPERVLVGRDVAGGQSPQFTVPAWSWQGSTSAGAWTLVGTTMAPPFAPDGCEFVSRQGLEALAAEHPGSADRLRELG